MKKKVLLISVKAGYGHHSTAQALIDYFTKHDVECEMLDTFEYISTFLGDSIQDGYLLLTKSVPEFYGKVYDKFDKNNKPKESVPVAMISKVVAKKIRDYVVSYGADVIIGTHSYACLLMSYLRKQEHISCPLYGIVTDFTVHPFWESADIDYYVTPDILLNNQMMKKGIPESKILPFGIPIKEKFAHKIAKSEARAMLGIKDKTTILVMMGSMGFGNIAAELEKITSVTGDFQVLCVCGTNEKMRRAVEEKEWEKDVYVYGFVDNVDVMMDASDCIITKPGGLTSSELMAKGLPAILTDPIPGQEDRNLEFLVNSGACMMITKTFPVDEALYQIMNCEWRLEFMKESVARLGKPDATERLCNFIMDRF